jgi:drug/metabolite transporter (DMT)-like permease
MSKYSDHTTMGEQVLAHRFRMMAQNWRIIGLVGYLSGLAFFIFFFAESLESISIVELSLLSEGKVPHTYDTYTRNSV